MPIATPWMTAAESYLGLSEKPGTIHESKIVGFFAEVGSAWITTDEDAWCAAFAGSMLKRSGYQIPAGVEAVRARGYGAPVALKVTEPRYGDIVLIGKPGAISHVTFYVEDAGDWVKCLGGNQSNQVKVSKYRKTGIEGYYRPIKSAVVRPAPRPSEPVPAPPDVEPAPEQGKAPTGLVGLLAAIWKAIFWKK